jgi:hypothetical protein
MWQLTPPRRDLSTHQGGNPAPKFQATPVEQVSGPRAHTVLSVHTLGLPSDVDCSPAPAQRNGHTFLPHSHLPTMSSGLQGIEAKGLRKHGLTQEEKETQKLGQGRASAQG